MSRADEVLQLVSSNSIDPIGVTQEAEAQARRRRDRRAVLTAATGYASRFTALAVSLITVPLLLNHLGAERYGVWLTVSAGAAWVGLVHLGLAPSLLTRLSATPASDVMARGRTVSSGVVMAVVIGAAAAVVIVTVAAVMPWKAALNVTDPAVADQGRLAAIALWLSIAAGIPIAAMLAISRARQEGYRANVVEFVTVVVRLAILILLVRATADMGLLGLGVASASVGVGLLGGAWVLARAPTSDRPSIRAFHPSTARRLATAGAAFTAINVAALVISYTDVIVITQVLGPASVPAYAVSYALLTAFTSLVLVALDALWPAYGEATSTGDGVWLRATHRRVVIGCVAASLAFAGGLVVTGPTVIRAWAGEAALPPAGLLIVLGAIAVIQAYLLPYGRILIAAGHVRGYAVAGLLNAAVNLVVSIALARVLGIVGVALGTLIGYLLLAPLQIHWAGKVLREVEVARP